MQLQPRCRRSRGMPVCLARTCPLPCAALRGCGEGAKPPCSPARRRSPTGKGDGVRLFPWDTRLKTSLLAMSHAAEHGTGDSLHLLVSAAGQGWENAADCLIFTKNSLHLFISYGPLGTLPLLTNESSSNLIKQELLLLCFTSR